MSEAQLHDTKTAGDDSGVVGQEESLLSGATVVPVSFGVAHGYPDVDSWQAVALGHAPGHIYGRNTNPTVEAFEQKIRALEGAEDATSFSTGMAAISNTLFALLKPGDRIVSVKDTYGGTNQLFLDTLPRWGVEVILCDTADAQAVESAIGPGCALLFLETPTNRTLKITPIARLADAAHRAGRWSWSTTRWRRRSIRTRWRSARTSLFTAPPNTWVATRTLSAVRSAAGVIWCARCSITARSPVPASIR